MRKLWVRFRLWMVRRKLKKLKAEFVRKRNWFDTYLPGYLESEYERRGWDYEKVRNVERD